MKLKRFAWPGALVICVLALLVCAAWLSGQHHFQPMPKNLTTPPDVDRSHMPLGPYTADFSGLIGGPTGDKRVTFYVVMRPGDVHLQRVGEVGKRLTGASVTGLGISYQTLHPSRLPTIHNESHVDGLILSDQTIGSRPHFRVPGTDDARGWPIRVVCSLYPKGLAAIQESHTFRGVESGYCSAHFYPGKNLHAFLRVIPPDMMPEMAAILPKLYQQISERIHGEP